jgi:hypothetical protein
MMEEMGLPRSTKWSGYEAHHILPKNFYDHPILAKAGLNIDHASNGIFLPYKSKIVSVLSHHTGMHRPYSKYVEDVLNNMDPDASVDVLRSQLSEFQSALRNQLQNGLPMYQREGATVDLWRRKVGW